MPLLNKRNFQKHKPWRDAAIFIIICEGSNKEPDYFDFFDRLSSKIKVKTVPSLDGKSSPNHLIGNAINEVKRLNSDEGLYELWFIIDVDKWLEHGHIHQLQKECQTKKEWAVAISNPCFEVWLNAHFTHKQPDSAVKHCKTWKKFVHHQHGGFDHTKHPTLLPKAIKNSKNVFKESGYIPNIGCTQVYRVGEKILKLTKSTLKDFQ